MSLVVNLNVCRVCMNTENGVSLLEDIDLKTRFLFTTRLTWIGVDNMPTTICTKCVARLKVAYEFIQLAHASEKNLRDFLAKISDDFQMVRNANSPETIAHATTEADDVLLLLLESEAHASKDQESKDIDGVVATTTHSNTAVLKALPTTPNPAQTACAGNVVKKEGTSPPESLLHIKEENISQSFDKLVETTEEIDSSAFLDYTDEDFMIEAVDGNAEDGHDAFEESKVDKSYGISELSDGVQSETEIEMLDEDQQSSSNEQASATHASQQVEQPSDKDGFLQEYEAMLIESLGSEEHNFIDEKHTNVSFNLYYENNDDNLMGKPTEREREREPLRTELFEPAEPLHIQKRRSEITEISTKKSPSILGKARKSNRRPKAKRTPSPEESSSFYCAKCNRDFSTRTNLTRHMITHEGNKPYTCNICGKGFTQNTSLKQHMYTHTGEKPYVCDICNRGFTQCKSLVFHMRRHTGDKPFPCEICGIYFRQKDGLKAHILKYHLITEHDGDTKTHICIICKKVLRDKYSLQAHMKKHLNNHKPYTIATANEISASTGVNSDDSNLMEYIENENELLMEKDYSGAEMPLELEESTVHIVDVMGSSTAEPSRAKKFQCRKCFKCFSLKKSLIRHLKIHEESSSSVELDVIQCEECGIAFQSTNELEEHISIVHQQICPICPNLNYKTQEQLMEHMLEHQLDDVDNA